MTSGTDRLTEALELFDRTVRQTPEDRWSAASPCEGWTAKAVVGHVVGGSEMVSTMLETGQRPDPPSGDLTALVGNRPAEVWVHARKRLLAAVKTTDPLSTIATPQGALPVDVGLGQASLELLVHGWDLATATGQPFVMPTYLVEPLLAELEPLDAALRPTGMYGTRLPVAADSDPQQRLLAFLGRRAR